MFGRRDNEGHQARYGDGDAVTGRVSEVVTDRGYGYDDNGNMTDDGQLGYVVTTRYVYLEQHGAGWLPLLVRVSGPGTRESVELYTHGPPQAGTLGGAGGIGGIFALHPLLVGEGGGEGALSMHTDGNGSVIAITTTNGTLAASLDYAPFGSPRTCSGPSRPRFQFSLKEWDVNARLYYYGYRHYPPSLERWVNVVPLNIGLSINP